MRSCSARAIVAFLVVFLSVTSPAFAQSADAPATAAFVEPGGDGPTVPRNAFYVELGGNALIYSVNVDRLVTRHVSLRGGVMLLPDLFSGQGGLAAYAAPLSVSYLIGKGGHQVETGLGLVLGVGSRSGGEIDFGGGVSSTVTLGYRYQRGHRILRAGFTPVFQTHARPPLRYGNYTFPGTGGRPWQTSFGFSIGRTF